jgi:hypothetical protein
MQSNMQGSRSRKIGFLEGRIEWEGYDPKTIIVAASSNTWCENEASEGNDSTP